MNAEKRWHKRPATESTRGFTLMEVVIAIAFFSLLGFALFATLSSANNIFQMQTLNAGINQGGMQLIRSIGREIAESSPIADQSHLIITADASANSVVTFQVPVDWDNDGDVVQGTLNPIVDWGAYRFIRKPQLQSWLNYWVRYRVLDNQLLREILPSSNGNPTITDIIVPGDVLTFQVTSISTRRYNIILTLRKTDAIGQRGANARTYQTTFDGDTLLRNGG